MKLKSILAAALLMTTMSATSYAAENPASADSARQVAEAVHSVANQRIADVNAASADSVQQRLAGEPGVVFPIGEPNTPNAAHFTGDSYVAWLSDGGVPIGNVTFVDGAHTYWHRHHGSCQVLVAESGRGYYQIWGEEPHELRPGMTVTIPEGVKHWHGAAPHADFQHISVMKSVPGITTEWLEAVDSKLFDSLK